jgi:hypothetical protein
VGPGCQPKGERGRAPALSFAGPARLRDTREKGMGQREAEQDKRMRGRENSFSFSFPNFQSNFQIGL